MFLWANKLLSLSFEWLKLLIPLKTSDLKLLSAFAVFAIVSDAADIDEEREDTLALTRSLTSPVVFVPIGFGDTLSGEFEFAISDRLLIQNRQCKLKKFIFI